jgi:hypothetical protein
MPKRTSRIRKVRASPRHWTSVAAARRSRQRLAAGNEAKQSLHSVLWLKANVADALRSV